MSLGYMPPCNAMPKIGEPRRAQRWIPTDLMLCRSCDLVQLAYVEAPTDVFPADYPYVSGSTKILHDNFANLAKEAPAIAGMNLGDLVVDIGSNDGTLLSKFEGYRQLGIEPTDTANIAISNHVPTIQQYFSVGLAKRVVSDYGAVKLVTCANCFAHIPDVHAVVDGVLELLAPDGVFVTESHYLMGLIERLQYDTIYQEHLRYYSLNSLTNILKRHGLNVFHAKHIPSHGGSIRVYASREARTVSASAKNLAASELRADALHARLQTFARDVQASRFALLERIANAKRRGHQVVGLSAPSRGGTVVSYCGLDETMIDYVCEIVGSPKIGRYMPGTEIPVVDESRLFTDQPDYAIIFSWHIADELIPKLRAKGYKGEFILPCNRESDYAQAA
jgi:hypothetical protein